MDHKIATISRFGVTDNRLPYAPIVAEQSFADMEPKRS